MIAKGTRCGTSGKMKSKLEISSTSEYAILYVQRFYNVGRVNRAEIHGLNDEKIDLGNDEFRIVAAIEHTGNTFKSGHYIANVKINQNWWKCNDTSVTRVSGIEAKSNTISFLILEKIHVAQNVPID